MTRVLDFAKDDYAGQFFYGIPGTSNQISVAWASNWQYCNLVPTGPAEGWASVMTVPRENYLTNVSSGKSTFTFLVSRPYNIHSIFAQELAYNSSLGNSSILLDYAGTPSGALYYEANITGLSPDTLAGTLNFTFSSSLSGESVRGGTTVGGDTWISRQHTYGFDNPYFTDKFSGTGVYDGEANGTWTVSGIVDRTILEVFVNGGQQSGTMVFYPTRPLDTLWIGAAGIPSGAKVSVAVWGLESGWAEVENINGTVVGNVTSSG